MVEDEINKVIDAIVWTFNNNGKLLFIGNGGSATQAEHLAGEFVSSGYPAIALTNIAVVTAIANDYDYDEIFSRQILTFANKNDLIIALTTSGKSQNIRYALMQAKIMKVRTVVITCCNSPIGTLADFLIDFVFTNSKNKTQEVQEKTIKVGHELWKKSVERLEWNV